jgi:asparaginyl-tRNA synthetase
MVEPEMAYCNLDENMELAEQFVEYVVQWCLENCKEELDILERDISKLENVKAPFPRITYDEAAKILADNGADFTYGSDFGGTDETIISEQFDRPVMVHRWPAEIKAFYMKRDADNDNLALGVDMLAPEGYGEIIGGGQREDDLAILEGRIKEHELDMKDFSWYLDLRKYGSVPHSGFGLGIERTVAWITGSKHIRETIPFPRTMARLEP